MRPVTGAPFSEGTFTDATPDEVVCWCPQPNAESSKDMGTIMFVEDEKFVREVTAEVLCAAGYGVLIAQNAEDALRLYERHSGAVDLLLTDLVLPGQTGSELAQRLTSLDRRLKILFVTGYVDRLEAMEEHNCLPKPFSAPALLEKIRQVLDRREFAAAV